MVKGDGLTGKITRISYSLKELLIYGQIKLLPPSLHLSLKGFNWEVLGCVFVSVCRSVNGSNEVARCFVAS